MDTTAPTTATTAGRRTGALALAGALALSAFAPAAAADTAGAGGGVRRVVVTTAEGGLEGARGAARAVQAAGGTVLSSLPLIGGVGAELPLGATLAPAYAVVPDRPVQLSGLRAASAEPASGVRSTLGLGAPAGEGAGVTVAVVDTGVAEVGDLADRVTHVDVTDAAGPRWSDAGADGYGHGTFVAGLIAGDGTASGGAYAGIAPAASVLDVRVAADDGTTDLLAVLRGLQEVAVYDEDGIEDDRVDVDVLNLSLSSDSPLPYDRDPLTMALGALWDSGVTVVVPAGNVGPRTATVTSPGTHPTLLTVGALDDNGTTSRADDTVAAFSARGPAKGVAKPELVAPGRSVVSLRAPQSEIDTAHAAARVGEHYFTGSGTSFSTAVTAGAAAALLGEHEELLPPQLKGLLLTTTYSAPGLSDVRAAGAGGLDVGAAFALAASEAAPAEPTAAPGSSGKGQGGGRGAAVAPGASSWSANSWSANSWSASSWSASSWSASSWSASSWSASSWSASSWSASSWSASSWSASSWSASSWSAHSWGPRR
jgi:serine protease AprX